MYVYVYMYIYIIMVCVVLPYRLEKNTIVLNLFFLNSIIVLPCCLYIYRGIIMILERAQW